MIKPLVSVLFKILNELEVNKFIANTFLTILNIGHQTTMSCK